MKLFKAFFILLVISFSHFIQAQKNYSKAFGDANNTAIIYLHGGPGYHALNFELTTARKLADKGFYVIVYDRRGEGRSIDDNAKYTFEETLEDLSLLYKQYKLKKAVLIGHSFGGSIAIQYARKFPKKVKSIVLVGAPLNMQESLSNILAVTKGILEEKKDTDGLAYLQTIEKMDKGSIYYSGSCFMMAMKNGLYTPNVLSEDAQEIYNELSVEMTALKEQPMANSFKAPMGFWKNEQYTTQDYKSLLEQVLAKRISVFGLYGKEDGLFSSKQISKIETTLGSQNFSFLSNCSHNVYLDQQELFLNQLKEWIK